MSINTTVKASGLQIHEQESYDIHGGDELKYIYIPSIGIT